MEMTNGIYFIGFCEDSMSSMHLTCLKQCLHIIGAQDILVIIIIVVVVVYYIVVTKLMAW